MFRRIFASGERKDLLIGFLNALLDLDGSSQILGVVHLAREERTTVKGLPSIVDVNCTDAGGGRFVVKLLVLNVDGFERTAFDRAVSDDLTQRLAGEPLRAPMDLVGVVVSDFTLWPLERGGARVPMLSHWHAMNLAGQSGVLHLTTLELPKYAAGDAPKTLVEKWAYFFREAKNVEVVPHALDEAPFRNAFEAARTATFNVWEWEAYDREKIAEQDQRGALTLARREGHQEGRQEGHQAGRIEGARGSLRQVLAIRSLALGPEDESRIEGCSDLAALERWLRQAMTAASASEALR